MSEQLVMRLIIPFGQTAFGLIALNYWHFKKPAKKELTLKRNDLSYKGRFFQTI